ncbi:formylglycine-generating enzyme family protein [Candidatus Venteria ishoeyi]|uniref:Serine/threonine-protein kinase pkn1 n=1 Tax=Candidatus Venteria ishoeyi TaxID=1899563 RepID=A0A1H6FC38_9GAMM|nr:SUMF1/EgtB/PvdO family nonheme iron enzyme [Candidatus Venteria ishoeyi]MDM8545330.1 SUMF1/EgtB/PvdO family nonheme iron enzyme [Candidatus Venteria ishoeyi]SEH07213.1 Serine/threonine-protein kinase pkn1 [Candidatus Venteria ishoeyi]
MPSVSTEAKAKAEAKRLMAEVNQLQAQAKNQHVTSYRETQKLIVHINQLQVAAIKEKSAAKAEQAKQETKRLFTEKFSHIQDKQKNIHAQINRLLQVKQKYDLLAKTQLAIGKKENPNDTHFRQQLMGLIKQKKEEFIRTNKEAENIHDQARKKSIILTKNGETSQVVEQATEKKPQATDISPSLSDKAKAEAEKLITEVTAPKNMVTADKAEEVGKMIQEISKLQMAAEQGTLTESEALLLEERILKVESKQRESREQINQLTQAKIKYELALSRNAEQRKHQDERLRGELNHLITEKEQEQNQLLDELNMIRMHSEQEAKLLKAQRDAARALAEQQSQVDASKLPQDSKKYGMLLGVVVLILLLGGGAGVFFLTPWLNPDEDVPLNDKLIKNSVAPVAAVSPVEEQAAPPKVKRAVKRKLKPIRIFQDKLSSGALSPIMIQLPAGAFKMGSPPHYPYTDEHPQQTINLQSFSISQFEISFDEYQVFIRATGRKMPFDNNWGQDKRPVINVNWQDATAYAQWLSQETGYQYYLPSEREWEYAARAGSKTTFWWGNKVGKNHANCAVCSSQWSGVKTAPVGSFSPNSFGLHDMIGNVLEWTRTCYHPNYQNAPTGGQNWEGGNCAQRMVRGSAYNSYKRDIRITRRKAFTSKSRNTNLGFRVVRVN